MTGEACHEMHALFWTIAVWQFCQLFVKRGLMMYLCTVVKANLQVSNV